jgi:hypothetical protein
MGAFSMLKILRPTRTANLYRICPWRIVDEISNSATQRREDEEDGSIFLHYRCVTSEEEPAVEVFDLPTSTSLR